MRTALACHIITAMARSGIDVSPAFAEAGTLEALVASFRRSLRAANRSPATVANYSISVELLRRHLERRGLPTTAAALRREHLVGFLSELVEQGAKPATAATRYRGLRAFFAWALSEDEIAEDVSRAITPPRVPEQPVAMPSDADVKKLIGACAGPDLLDRRDRAMILTFIDCGLRRGELLGLALEHVDLEAGVLQIFRAKGGSPRAVACGNTTAAAIDRYIRMRGRLAASGRPELWLTREGHPLTASSVNNMFEHRSAKAHVTPIHPHALRHYSVHRFLGAGGTESSAQRLYGWRSADMLMRYAAARGVERALGEHRRLGIVDRL